MSPTPPGALDDTLDGAPFGFLSVSDEAVLLAVNRTAAGLLGYAAHELAGRPLQSVLSVGAAIFYQTHLFPLVRMQGRADEIYLHLRARDGATLGVLVNAVRRERGGAPVNDFAFTRVGEREKFEEELLRARRAAEGALASLAARTRELEQSNELLQSQAVELELTQQALEEHALELELQREALQAANEALQERSDELERQRARAEEASHAKSSFLTVMSHELRTPLNAIGGYVQLLEMGIHGPVTEEQLEVLARVDRSQRHLLRLVNDVLNLSRIEAGRVDYAVQDVALAALAGAVVPMVEPQLAAKGIRLRVEVAPEYVARADEDKAQQILLNLLGNAAKFTPEGGEVRVESRVRRDEPRFVFLRVADTGPGIPRSMLDSIFQPFVQVDTSHTRRAEGTGLGLAISRDLARGMGGDLRARSAEGEGSVFTLALPRAGG